jgi:type I restriction enzyme S subunit
MGTVVVGKGEKQKSAKKGDIFFLMSSEGYEDIGKTSVLADDIDETYLNSFCKGFRVNQSKCNPFFLNYLMLSDYYRKLLVIEGKGFTRINLKMEKVTDFNIIIPSSIAEQQQIADYLDRKLETISNIVSNIQSQIAKLKELRKTLINDVVTGKIMVTE